MILLVSRGPDLYISLSQGMTVPIIGADRLVLCSAPGAGSTFPGRVLFG